MQVCPCCTSEPFHWLEPVTLDHDLVTMATVNRLKLDAAVVERFTELVSPNDVVGRGRFAERDPHNSDPPPAFSTTSSPDRLIVVVIPSFRRSESSMRGRPVVPVVIFVRLISEKRIVDRKPASSQGSVTVGVCVAVFAGVGVQ